jgi:DNA polymerase III sliding clamp (beta) subunit (PCNA family)
MKRQELLDALEIVKPALAQKEIIEQSTSFAFMQGRVITYNDEISLSTPIPGLELEKDVAIQAEELYKLLGKIEREEIDIEVTDTELKVSAGRVKAGITLQQEIKLPLEEVKPQGKWKAIPANFVTGTAFVIPSCSKDMSKPIFTCVHVRADGCVEASDNFRITRYTIGDMPADFLLPASSAKDLVRYNVKHILNNKGWAHFKTESDTIFSCRVYDGEFPKLDAILDVKGEEVEFPEKTLAALDRASVFVNEEHSVDESVQISLGENKLKVKAKSDAGWFEESLNIKYSNEPFEFSINPAFLQAIVSQLRSCVIGKRCLKFTGDKWIHVVAHFEGS